MKRSNYINSILIVSMHFLHSGCSEGYKGEGELSFLRNNKALKKIAIKAVETNQWRAKQDIMYNDLMPDSCGMLFIFEQESELPFQINNDHQSFDIIFVAPNDKAVFIQKNVAQTSEQVKSVGNFVLYKYVVIVNAGFCETYSVHIDDSISFILNKQ